MTGFCLFVIGIWATVALNRYEDLPRPNNFDAVSVVLIIIGLVIACTGICGCYGAVKKNIFVLKMVKISVFSIRILLLLVLILVGEALHVVIHFY